MWRKNFPARFVSPSTNSGLLLLFRCLLVLGRGGLALGLGAVLGVLVPVLEFLHAASGVEQFHLAGEERMAGTGDFQLVERVLLAIGPLDGLIRVDTGPRQ